MTTNVPKGSGRATATAKRTKHAQRTPLPPKKGSPGAEAIEAASCAGGEEAHYAHMDLNDECPWDHASDRVAIMPDPAPEKPMGERTVAELRKTAVSLGVLYARQLKRGDLLNAILEAERAQTKTAERLAERDTVAEVFAVAEKSKAPSAPAPKAKTQPEPECTGDPNLPEGQLKSIGKAEAFLEAAAALGWAEKARSSPEQETYGVIVGRDEERIAISWHNGVFVGDECYHSHPGRSPRKVINASAAKKLMAIPPAEAAAEAQKVSAHKSARPGRARGAEATTARRKALPFDLELATDAEVIEAVRGKHVTWTSSISGEEENAYVVERGKGTTKIEEGKSGRTLTFLGMAGFRSVRVSSIVAVV